MTASSIVSNLHNNHILHWKLSAKKESLQIGTDYSNMFTIAANKHL
jgi:hypothetical protein